MTFWTQNTLEGIWKPGSGLVGGAYSATLRLRPSPWVDSRGQLRKERQERRTRKGEKGLISLPPIPGSATAFLTDENGQ